ncbi:MAG: hypothetical protein AAFX41_18270, partial [Bacteroidota bacterium]
MLHAPSPPRFDFGPSRAGIALVCLLVAWGLLSGCGASAPIIPPATALDQEPPRLLNAFFGLDDALPRGTRILCRAAPGSDGMPVTFSRRVLSVDADDFAVVTESGARKTPRSATVRPAD